MIPLLPRKNGSPVQTAQGFRFQLFKKKDAARFPIAKPSRQEYNPLETNTGKRTL